MPIYDVFIHLQLYNKKMFVCFLVHVVVFQDRLVYPITKANARGDV